MGWKLQEAICILTWTYLTWSIQGLPFSSGLISPVDPCWVDNALHNRQSSLWIDSMTSSASFQLGLEVSQVSKILPFLIWKVIFWIGIVLYFQPPSQIRKFVLPSRFVFDLIFISACRHYVLILTVMLIGTVRTQVVDISPHEIWAPIPVELKFSVVTLPVSFPCSRRQDDCHF